MFCAVLINDCLGKLDFSIRPMQPAENYIARNTNKNLATPY